MDLKMKEEDITLCWHVFYPHIHPNIKTPLLSNEFIFFLCCCCLRFHRDIQSFNIFKYTTTACACVTLPPSPSETTLSDIFFHLCCLFSLSLPLSLQFTVLTSFFSSMTHCWYPPISFCFFPQMSTSFLTSWPLTLHLWLVGGWPLFINHWTLISESIFFSPQRQMTTPQ